MGVLVRPNLRPGGTLGRIGRRTRGRLAENEWRRAESELSSLECARRIGRTEGTAASGPRRGLGADRKAVRLMAGRGHHGAATPSVHVHTALQRKSFSDAARRRRTLSKPLSV